MPADPKQRVAVIYDGFPHYRKGIIEELASSSAYDYYFFGNAAYRDPSIRAYVFKEGVRIIHTRGISIGPLHVQTGILAQLLRHHISHCIFLGNPWFVSYWLLTPILRLLGKRVYFWSHGWLAEQEPALRGTLKHAFFKMSDALLLYGHRAKRIGLDKGFAAHRIHVIGNSLDYARQKEIFAGLEGRSQADLRRELQLPLGQKIIICTARVTLKCRFDVLLHAASEANGLGLNSPGPGIFVLIVGEGPEQGPLAALAQSLGVTCRFWGACYDEAIIAKLYKASDLTVSPGKVGLTAIHSMTYGTPVISHDNFDNQMPECEAIIPGRTGAFFVENSSAMLASVIRHWFNEHPNKPESECVAVVEANFTPISQRLAIENALQESRSPA